MITQDLLEKLSAIEESARVNRHSIVRIINNADLTEEEKNDAIKGITLPLTLNNKKLITEIGDLYKK